MLRIFDFGSREYEQSVELRYEVLRKPLGLQFDPVQLARESQDLHLGYFDQGVIQACLILKQIDQQQMQMKQVAVSPALQGHGLGRTLVEFAERVAREKGVQHMLLHARAGAIPFYLKLGYQVESDEFMEVGIPHRLMARALG